MSNASNKILEWIDEESKVETQKPEEPEKKSYDRKIVAWIDVLGIREKIKNDKENDAETIFEIMRKLNFFVKDKCEILIAKQKLTYLQIADGFMIAADLDCHLELCEILSKVQWLILIELKMLSRGAVTVGNVGISDDDNLIIGPAYVEAYQLECENAIFSRVILDKSFISEFDDVKKEVWINEDMDKFYYIDFLSYIMKTENMKPKTINERLERNGVVDVIKKGYNHKKTSVIQKYSWFISLLKMNEIPILKYTEREEMK